MYKFIILVFTLILLSSCVTTPPIQITKIPNIQPQKLTEKSQNLFFSVEQKIKISQQKGSVVEVQSGGFLCVPRMTFYADPGLDKGQTSESKYISTIINELNNFNIKTTELNIGTELRIDITRQEMNTCYPNVFDNNFSKGETYISINWKLVDKKDNFELFSYTTEASHEIKNAITNGAKILVQETLRANVRKLINNKDFRLILTLNKSSNKTPKTEKVSQKKKIIDTTYNILDIKQNISKIFSKDRSTWSQGVFTIIVNEGHGSGFAISDNLILTNYHVVEDAAEVIVKMEQEDGFIKSTKGKVIRRNAERDIALIEIRGKLKNYFSVSNAKQKQGNSVFVIGTPLDIGLESTMTQGIIGHSKRIINGLPFIQGDANIYGGNSGGPMISTNGKVVGVSVLAHSEAEGINLFIPIQSALEFLKIKIDI